LRNVLSGLIGNSKQVAWITVEQGAASLRSSPGLYSIPAGLFIV
jgi:hypothetical protein